MKTDGCMFKLAAFRLGWSGLQLINTPKLSLYCPTLLLIINNQKKKEKTIAKFRERDQRDLLSKMHQAELHFPQETQLLGFKAFAETHLSFFKFKVARAQILIASLLQTIGLFMSTSLIQNRVKCMRLWSCQTCGRV